jgi:hypothetical protein
MDKEGSLKTHKEWRVWGNFGGLPKMEGISELHAPTSQTKKLKLIGKGGQ